MPELLTPAALTEALGRLPEWRGDGQAIRRSVTCASFPAAIRLVTQVADAAEAANHHPDIDIRWRTVTFVLSTHSAGGVTELDLQLAGRIDVLAADQ